MNNKKILQEKLLNQLEITPMNRQEMADFLGVTVVFVSRYITQLRKAKKIYISHYERTLHGKPKSFYKTGDLPDAKELPPIPQRILQKKYRELNKRELTPRKITPKMDVAASWMKNPC